MDTTTKMAFKLAQAPINSDGMSEYIGAQFVCDRPYILRPPNDEYIKREIEWYDSQSRYVDEIPGETPKIWKEVAGHDGKINSNYGWCIYSSENGFQFNAVVKELRKNPMSRRAVMYYTHPLMHTKQYDEGMNDHMCTTHVQYLIRNKQLSTYVYMRSNDAVFGFNNDYAWQQTVTTRLAKELRSIVAGTPELVEKVGPIVWNVGSLHVYPRHQSLLENYR
jgi:thymidylate synthase